MKGDGCGNEGGAVELKNQLSSVNKRVIEDGVVSKDKKLVEDDVKDRLGGSVQISPPIQQQSQGTTVCWERFLHLRTLRVLLVENDDSTRFVVSALLRNCSYEVIEASNGVQAWKILEDLANHVDIVLTEVVMPFVSGVGLLCKIMSHKTRKNVPVIMMSSHDSMGLVFKCLSKGAVDFLVKPIRKNELKILWQHVWRRCHSSSGSGSESGSVTQTQKSVKSKNVEKSDNNNSSNDEDIDGSFGPNIGSGSDDGSGTQSSWTKQDVEVESPRALPLRDQVSDCPDSTCAQVINSNGEVSGNKQVHVSKEKEHQEVRRLENSAIDKDLGIGVPQKPDLNLKLAAEDPKNPAGIKQSNLLGQGCSGFDEHEDKGLVNINSANLQHKVGIQGVLTLNAAESCMGSAEFKISDSVVKASTEGASFEPSLKRVRGAKDVSKSNQDERNVLRRSDFSAFSRYNAASNSNKASGGNTQSGTPVVASLHDVRNGTFHDRRSNSVNNNPNHRSNVESNTVDMGSTTNNAFLESAVSKNKSGVISMVQHAHAPSASQPTEGDEKCIPHQISLEKADDLAGTKTVAQPSDSHMKLPNQHLQHYGPHCHLLSEQHHPQPAKHDDSTSKKMMTTPHRGSSNGPGGPFEGNACNCSINGSASGSNHGSNHGSNGNNGSSPAVHAGATNMESDNGVAGKSGSGGADASGTGGGNGSDNGSGSGSGDKLDPDRLLQREAALAKFRQKRKDRCFRKKVRYQSRKKLAEARPRFRGQFVRKEGNESNSRATSDS
ncbi:Two-component response regulator-like APRR7 [Linum perenne]